MKGHLEESDIALLAAGEAGAGGVTGGARHLAECPACAARLENYKRDRRSLAEMRESAITASDFDRLRQSVLDHIRQTGSRPSSFAFYRWAALAAAVLVASAVGIWWNQRTPTPQQSQLSVPAAPAADDRATAKLQPDAGSSEAPVTRRVEEDRLSQASRAPKPKPASDRFTHEIQAASVPSLPVPSPPVQDDVVMKLETSDPNITIIWLASPKGAGR